MSEQSEVSSESVLCVISCENLTNMTLSHFSSFLLVYFSLKSVSFLCVLVIEKLTNRTRGSVLILVVV